MSSLTKLKDVGIIQQLGSQVHQVTHAHLRRVVYNVLVVRQTRVRVGRQRGVSSRT
jgi:hypothetical protein